MWTVLEFKEGLQFVPSKWLVGDDKCMWPPFTKQESIDKAIKEKIEVGANWNAHLVTRVFYETDSYSKAHQKMRKAENTSDLDTTENEEESKLKRREKARKVNKDDEHPNLEKARPRQKINLPELATPTPPALPAVPAPKSIEPSSSPKLMSISTPEKELPKKKKSDADYRILKKLNTILFELRKIDERISKLENKDVNSAKSDNSYELQYEQEIEDLFPIQNLEEINKLNSRLESEKTYFSKMVSTFKMFGGFNTSHTTFNILKKILSNTVAEYFSYLGAKKKLGFKNLAINKVVLASVRARHPETTEQEYATIVAKFLVQAKLRATRENIKDMKEKQKLGEREDDLNNNDKV